MCGRPPALEDAGIVLSYQDWDRGREFTHPEMPYGPLCYLLILRPPGEWGRSNNLLSFKGSLLSIHGSFPILLKASASKNVSQNDSLLLLTLLFLCWKTEKVAYIGQVEMEERKVPYNLITQNDSMLSITF